MFGVVSRPYASVITPSSRIPKGAEALGTTVYKPSTRLRFQDACKTPCSPRDQLHIQMTCNGTQTLQNSCLHKEHLSESSIITETSLIIRLGPLAPVMVVPKYDNPKPWRVSIPTWTPNNLPFLGFPNDDDFLCRYWGKTQSLNRKNPISSKAGPESASG